MTCTIRAEYELPEIVWQREGSHWRLIADGETYGSARRHVGVDRAEPWDWNVSPSGPGMEGNTGGTAATAGEAKAAAEAVMRERGPGTLAFREAWREHRRRTAAAQARQAGAR